jgi:hypothetical protein
MWNESGENELLVFQLKTLSLPETGEYDEEMLEFHSEHFSKLL